MISSVKIGFVDSPGKSQIIPWLKNRFVASLSEEATDKSMSFVEITPSDLWSGLSSGEMGAIAIPLDKAPFEIPETMQYFCLTSLPERRRRRILCNPEVYQEDNDGKLANNTRILVENNVLGSQVLHLNPTLEICIGDTKNFILPPKRELDKPDAVLLFEDSDDIETLSDAGCKSIQLHPNEFLEVAGFGKLVWPAHKESVQLMMALRSIFHHLEMVACANTERKIQQKLSSLNDWEVRVRCFQDQRKFYHVRAMMIHAALGTVVAHNMSQSTHHLLAEKMTSVLLDLIKK